MKRNHKLLLAAAVVLLACAALIAYRNLPREVTVPKSDADRAMATDMVLRCTDCEAEVVVSYNDPSATTKMESRLEGEDVVFKCEKCSAFALRVVRTGEP